MDSKRNTGKEKNMIGFKKFMNLTAQKKCPPGFRFDDKLKVCVLKVAQGRYYGAYGFGVLLKIKILQVKLKMVKQKTVILIQVNGNGKGSNTGNGGNGGN